MSRQHVNSNVLRCAVTVQLLSCPYTHPHTDIQPAVETLLVAWMSHYLLGKPLGSAWTAVEGGFLQLKPNSTAY